MKKVLFSFLLLFCFLVQINGQGKQKVSVLYVGGSADIETMGTKVDSVKLAASIKERMASFASFLKSHFKTVKVINAKDYVQSMSNKYDVTVFDGKPKPIRPEIREYNDKGQITKYARPAYLTEDFDRPAVFIANASSDLGSSIGSKNDWFCLCLEADAHHWVKNHPIFKGPFKVAIHTEIKPTPSHAFQYAEMYGYTLPATTEMWNVQTKNFETDPAYRIGMVSRPLGYLDSPETEIISSGVCAKSIDAVAIGRHANLFHWGFSASPTYLTEAGKAAFANSIVYISKFAGQHLIARKYQETIVTREELSAVKYRASKECWKAIIEQNRSFRTMVDSIKTLAKAKKARGEELSSTEAIYIDFQFRQEKEQTYREYMKSSNPDLYKVFGDDAEEYARYYDKNKAWFRPDNGGYGLVIDEEVRSLGIANNDKRMLETCISMLEKGEDVELATTILNRYTLCRFSTPAEWRKWFDTYNDKMFFTEAGGWLWLINTMDKSVPGNDYSVLKEDTEEAKLPEIKGETSNQNPVLLSAAVEAKKDGTKEIAIRMMVHQGYHTYANVSEKDPFIPTKIEIILPDGYKFDGDMVTPVVSQLSGSETTIYTGDVVFRQRVSGSGKGEVTCVVTYQCCNDKTCLPPAEVELKAAF